MIFPPLPAPFVWVGCCVCVSGETADSGVPFYRIVASVHPDGEDFLKFMDGLIEMGIEQGRRCSPLPPKTGE